MDEGVSGRDVPAGEGCVRKGYVKEGCVREGCVREGCTSGRDASQGGAVIKPQIRTLL